MVDKTDQFKLLNYGRWLQGELEMYLDAYNAQNKPIPENVPAKGALGAYRRTAQAFRIFLKYERGAKSIHGDGYKEEIMDGLAYETIDYFLNKSLGTNAENKWVAQNDPEQHFAYIRVHEKFENAFPNISDKVRKQ